MPDQTPEMPQEVRTFMEKARGEGWSDEEIVGYVKEHQAKVPSSPAVAVDPPSLTDRAIQYGKDSLSTMKGFGEGLIPGALQGLVKLPGTLLDTAKAGATLMSDPGELVKSGYQIGRNLPATLKAGYNAVTNPTPIEGEPMSETSGKVIGKFVGEQATPLALGTDEVSGAMLHPVKSAVRLGGAANRVAAAGMSAVENNPVLAAGAGAAIGYGHSGIPGAIEGAILGPPSTRVLRILRGMSDRAEPASMPTVRSVPIEPAPPVVQAPSHWDEIAARAKANVMADMRGLPEGRPPIITPPPADTSGMTVTTAKRGLPVRDPATGRMKRVFTSESAGESSRSSSPALRQESTPGDVTPAESTKQPASKVSPSTQKTETVRTSVQSKVQALNQKGHGAEEIADQLKDDPAFKGKTRTERINLVREARGGPSGEMPARAKQAIDQALSKLKTADDKRAYLMRAPNAVAYDYIKGKIGL